MVNQLRFEKPPSQQLLCTHRQKVTICTSSDNARLSMVCKSSVLTCKGWQPIHATNPISIYSRNYLFLSLPRSCVNGSLFPHGRDTESRTPLCVQQILPRKFVHHKKKAAAEDWNSKLRGLILAMTNSDQMGHRRLQCRTLLPLFLLMIKRLSYSVAYFYFIPISFSPQPPSYSFHPSISSLYHKRDPSFHCMSVHSGFLFLP